MTNKFILFWTWLTIIMMGILGVLFIFNPGGALPPGSTVEDIARMLGLKNLVYGGLLLYAAVRKSHYLLVVLLIGRGITDMLDGGVMMALGNRAVPYMASFVTGFITLIAGFALSKQPKPPKTDAV